MLAGCGEDSSNTAIKPAGSPGVELTAREADCSDWNRATTEQRLATIESLREFEGGPTTGGTGAVLPDEQAYELFENYCSDRFATAFKLYKLYARAAAFQSVVP